MKVITAIPGLHIFEILPLAYVKCYKHFAYRGRIPWSPACGRWSRKSSVYCAFLDANKAFDPVNYCKLFRLLLKRYLPACVIRVSIVIYCSCNMERSLLRVFSCKNGVKQGGVLSPAMFCVYIDDLLVQLARIGLDVLLGKNCWSSCVRGWHSSGCTNCLGIAQDVGCMWLICYWVLYIIKCAKKSKCMVLLPGVCVSISCTRVRQLCVHD